VSRRSNLEELRRLIDAIDMELLELLNRRTGFSLEIGVIKREEGRVVYDPAREREILESVQSESKGPLTPQAVRRLYERILDESRSQERAANFGVTPPARKERE
jgi:chorismate mutase